MPLLPDMLNIIPRVDTLWLIQPFLLILALIVVVMRATPLIRLAWVEPQAFLPQLSTILEKATLEQAAEACRRSGRSAVARLAWEALNAAKAGGLSTEDATHALQTRLIGEATRWKAVLPTFANLAALLGLIGSILHLFQPYGGPIVSAPEHRSLLLVYEIAAAMSHTAAGLSVAAFCMINQLWLEKLSRAVVSNSAIVTQAVPRLLRERVAWADDLA